MCDLQKITEVKEELVEGPPQLGESKQGKLVEELDNLNREKKKLYRQLQELEKKYKDLDRCFFRCDE